MIGQSMMMQNALSMHDQSHLIPLPMGMQPMIPIPGGMQAMQMAAYADQMNHLQSQQSHQSMGYPMGAPVFYCAMPFPVHMGANPFRFGSPGLEGGGVGGMGTGAQYYMPHPGLEHHHLQPNSNPNPNPTAAAGDEDRGPSQSHKRSSEEGDNLRGQQASVEDLNSYMVFHQSLNSRFPYAHAIRRMPATSASSSSDQYSAASRAAESVGDDGNVSESASSKDSTTTT
jgi:hypothetical protein